MLNETTNEIIVFSNEHYVSKVGEEIVSNQNGFDSSWSQTMIQSWLIKLNLVDLGYFTIKIQEFVTYLSLLVCIILNTTQTRTKQ